MVLIALTSVALLSASFLASRAPAWWPVRSNPRTEAVIAADLENAVVNQLHAARPMEGPSEGQKLSESAGQTEGQPTGWTSALWSVSLSESDANAWLAARLPKWLANQDDPIEWPAELSVVQSGFEEGRLQVGAQVLDGRQTRYVSCQLRLWIDDRGRLWAPADWVRLGRLAVPAEWIVERAFGAAKPISRTIGAAHASQRVAAALRGEEPLLDNPVLKLADGRHVRLVRLLLKNGHVEITCRTER